MNFYMYHTICICISQRIMLIDVSCATHIMYNMDVLHITVQVMPPKVAEWASPHLQPSVTFKITAQLTTDQWLSHSQQVSVWSASGEPYSSMKAWPAMREACPRQHTAVPSLGCALRSDVQYLYTILLYMYIYIYIDTHTTLYQPGLRHDPLIKALADTVSIYTYIYIYIYSLYSLYIIYSIYSI